MGVLSKLFRKGESQTTATTVEVACRHTALTARWDRPEDMGKQDLASSFHCETCGEDFSGDEGRRLLQEKRVTLGD